MCAVSLKADDYFSTQNGDWHTGTTWGKPILTDIPKVGQDTATIRHSLTMGNTGSNSGTMLTDLTIENGGSLTATNARYIGAETLLVDGTLNLSGTYSGTTGLTGGGTINLTNKAGLNDSAGNFANVFKIGNLSNDDSFVAANIETGLLTLNGNARQLGAVSASNVSVYKKALSSTSNASNFIVSPIGTALTMASGGTIKGSTSKRAESILCVMNTESLVYGQNSASAAASTANGSTTSIDSKGTLSVNNITLYTMDMNLNGNTLNVNNATINSIDRENSKISAEYLKENDVITYSGVSSSPIANPTAETDNQIGLSKPYWDGSEYVVSDSDSTPLNPGLKGLDVSDIYAVADTNTDMSKLSTIENVDKLNLNNAHIQANVSGVKEISFNGTVNAIDGVLSFKENLSSFELEGYESNTLTKNVELHLGGIKFGVADSTLTLTGKLTTYISNLSNSNIKTITVKNGSILGAGGNYDGDMVFQNGSAHYMNFSNLRANNVDYNSGAKVYVGFDGTGKVNQVVTLGSVNFAGNNEIRIVNQDGGTKDKVYVLDDIFSAAGGIKLNGTTLSNDTVSATGGTVTFGTGNNTLKITSNKSTSGAVNSATVSGNGEFLSVNYTATGVADTLFDVADADDPTPGPGPDPVTPSRLSSNQRSIYGALSPDLKLVVDGSKTEKEMTTILNQLSPVIHTATPQIVQRAVTRAAHTHYDRHRTLLDFHDVKGLDFDAYPNPDSVFLGQSKPIPCRQLWFSNYGDWSCEKGSYGDGNNGYYSNMYGLNAGYDKFLGDGWVGGISLGGAWDSFHSRREEDHGKGNISTFVLSGYASWTDYCWYFGTSIGYTYSSIRLERGVPSLLETAESTHNGNQAFLSFELARKIEFGCFFVSPYYGLDLIFLGESGFTEKGAEYAGLSVDRRTTMSYLQNFGARLGTEFMICDSWMMEPYFYGGWVHDFGGSQVRSVGSFANDGVGTFEIAGSRMHKNRGVLGLNLDITFSDCISGNLGWDFEFNPDYNASNFRLGIQKVW